MPYEESHGAASACGMSGLRKGFRLDLAILNDGATARRSDGLFASLFVLGAITFLPTLMFYFLSPSGAVTSLATGMLGACIVTIGVALAGYARMTSAQIVKYASFMALVLVLLVAHFLVANLAGGGSEIARMVGSCAVLMLMMAGAAAGASVLENGEASLERTIAIVRWSLVAFTLLSVIGIRPFPGNYEKPVFPFVEPSHMALMLAPFLMHACFNNRGVQRGMWLILGLALGYTAQSLTLVICVISSGLMCMSVPGILAATTALVVGLGFLDLSYFTDRLDFSSDTTNISTLVYIQGWELFQDALYRTSGWGVGFQQLGFGQVNSPTADILFRIVRSDLLMTDGGFLLSKTLSEFGITGIAIVSAYIYLFIRSLHMVRRAHKDNLQPALVFALSSICSFTMDIFVRGLGYFSGESMLFLVSLYIVSNNRARLRRLVSTRARMSRR